MSINPVTSKIAAPYARGLFEFAVERKIINELTNDFNSISKLFNNYPQLKQYLNNPVVKLEAKREILTKLIKSEVKIETFQFLMVLVSRNRFFIYDAVVESYLKLVYKATALVEIKVVSAVHFSKKQETTLKSKVQALTNANMIRLEITVDPTLLAGFLIKTDSKVIDFTIKNQLIRLAKHLDTVLEI